MNSRERDRSSRRAYTETRPAESSTSTGHHPFRSVAALLAAVAAATLCAPALGAPSDPPRITNATLSPSRFAVDPHGPSEVQAGAARGTTFRYDLSKKAEVFFFLDRATPGRLVGGHCHRATSHNRHHRRCARFVRSGSFKQAAKEGTNVKSFSGRIGSLTLAPARYRVKLVAVDDMGNPSSSKPVLRFTIVR